MKTSGFSEEEPMDEINKGNVTDDIKERLKDLSTKETKNKSKVLSVIHNDFVAL